MNASLAGRIDVEYSPTNQNINGNELDAKHEQKTNCLQRIVELDFDRGSHDYMRKLRGECTRRETRVPKLWGRQWISQRTTRRDSSRESSPCARLHDAEVSTTARHCKDVLDRFGAAVLGSRAVISRSLAIVQELVESDKRTYVGFHKQLAAGARVAEDNKFDRIRTQVESALFPNFHSEIIFGCLSLGGSRLTGYGEYAMVIKDKMIAHRATVFDENPITLSKKLKLSLTDPFPPGYRAVWSERDSLAKAKLHSDINSDTKDDDFPHILLNDRGGTADSDFIEVHIFGPLNQQSIERVIGPVPKTRDDRLIWQRLQRQLAKAGIEVETV